MVAGIDGSSDVCEREEGEREQYYTCSNKFIMYKCLIVIRISL